MTDKELVAKKNGPKITKQRRFSAIWLIPILALAFGSWLAYKAISERGTYITIEFQSANGIVPEKTEVKYKGLSTGLVKSVRLAEDFDKVLVTVEIKSLSADVLTENAMFWYVTANISIDGVSGLDTLLSGSYISISPDIEMKGQPQKQFIALDKPPSLSESTPGLHIQLVTDQLNSIQHNTKIHYKQLVVGHVTNYRYNKKTNQIEINAFITPQYAHLVKENTRFWNSSGISFSANLATGVKLRTGSVESILSGGISFDTLPYLEQKPLAKNGRRFSLYNDFDTAQTGHELELYFDWNTGYLDGAPILLKGAVVGRVVELLDIDPEQRLIRSKAHIDPRAVPYLTDKTKFYVVAAKISFAGIKNIETALSGKHIKFTPNARGKLKSSFDVLPQKPALSFDEPGLHLLLTTSDLGSLTLHSTVSYQQQPVGSIQKISHLATGEAQLQIHIEPQYNHLVNSNSRFWNTSGVRLTGNLQGFEIQTESFSSMLAGGISFANVPTTDAKESKINNGAQFSLYANKEQARQSIALTLYASSAKYIKSGSTKVLFQGVVVGSVHRMRFQHDKHRTELKVGLYPEFSYLLKEHTRFWLTSPSLSLSGLSDLQAILAGAYISFRAGDGQKQDSFALLHKPPQVSVTEQGLQLVLTSDNADSLAVGSPIFYKNIEVGQLNSYRLAADGSEVIINATIAESYRHLVTGHTRFYNLSGISVTGDISGVNVNTGSIDTILTGGIGFYNPATASKAKVAPEGSRFRLYDNERVAKSAGLAITIDFDDIGGLTVGQKIKYRQQVVGQITRLDFDKRMERVKVFALLEDHGRELAVAGSTFWIAKPKIGLVGNRNIDAFLASYIQVQPGQGAPQTEFKGSNNQPIVKKLSYGLNVKLVAEELGSVRVGDPILYKQVNVGKVIGVDLAPLANNVLIYINIQKKYASLVRPDSKFWNVSGIVVDAGLFSGVNIKTESLEAILAGGIAFATPDHSEGNLASKDSYTLYPQAKTAWKSWAPKVDLIP